MKKNIKWQKFEIFRKLKYIFILFFFSQIIQNDSKNIFFSNSVKNQKYWVGGEYEIVQKIFQNKEEKIHNKSQYHFRCGKSIIEIYFMEIVKLQFFDLIKDIGIIELVNNII